MLPNERSFVRRLPGTKFIVGSDSVRASDALNYLLNEKLSILSIDNSLINGLEEDSITIKKFTVLYPKIFSFRVLRGLSF